MDENDKKLNILFVCTECAPFCAKGGVADMCCALPKYLNKTEEVDIRVIMPFYKSIPNKFKEHFNLVGERNVELSWRNNGAKIYEYEYKNITFYFIENNQYFDRDKLFGYDDDIERFCFFSKAVLESLPIINFYPDIVHTNDWQSGIVSIFLKTIEWQNPRYEHIKTLFNIHNLNYQGIGEINILKDFLNIGEKFYYLFDFFGKANLTKASFLCSDKIVTVSETYKDEILETEKGNGLEGTLKTIEHKISGIINGIDYEFYNPETDSQIYFNYSKQNLEEKIKNKTAFQEELGLILDENIPIFAFIGHMAKHKGMELLKQTIEPFLEKNIEFVAIGSGDSEFEEYFKSINEKFIGKVKVIIGYDNKLAKKIYASADFLFNVSSIEPCGLCPMIASAYGTLPIVYLTGGIKDNFSDFKKPYGNAYVLTSYDDVSLSDLIERCLRDFEDKEKFISHQKNCMEQNFDIENCAKKYLELYKEI